MTLRTLRPVSLVSMVVVASCGGMVAPSEAGKSGSPAVGGTSVTVGGHTSRPSGGNTALGLGGNPNSRVTRCETVVFYDGSGGSVASGGSSYVPCAYKGTNYAVGEDFTDSDGCTHCSCYGSEDAWVACSNVPCIQCAYQGLDFWLVAGVAVPAIDGCNTCTCVEGGLAGPASVRCSNFDCTDGCSYAGRRYADSTSFASTDGCNTCTCSRSIVECTALDCMCDPEREYWRRYLSTSAGDCSLMDRECPSGSARFDNSCGCGCEQSVDCPSWFDCTPVADDSAGGTSGIGWTVTAGGSGTGWKQQVTCRVLNCAVFSLAAVCPLTPSRDE